MQCGTEKVKTRKELRKEIERFQAESGSEKEEVGWKQSIYFN